MDEDFINVAWALLTILFVLTWIIWSIFDKNAICKMLFRLPFFIWLMGYFEDHYRMDESEFIVVALMMIIIVGPVEMVERITGKKMSWLSRPAK